MQQSLLPLIALVVFVSSGNGRGAWVSRSCLGCRRKEEGKGAESGSEPSGWLYWPKGGCVRDCVVALSAPSSSAPLSRLSEFCQRESSVCLSNEAFSPGTIDAIQLQPVPYLLRLSVPHLTPVRCSFPLTDRQIRCCVRWNTSWARTESTGWLDPRSAARPPRLPGRRVSSTPRQPST